MCMRVHSMCCVYMCVCVREREKLRLRSDTEVTSDRKVSKTRNNALTFFSSAYVCTPKPHTPTAPCLCIRRFWCSAVDTSTSEMRMIAGSASTVERAI